MSKKLVLVLFILITTIGIFLVKNLHSVPAITYFPIDYGTSFDTASTNLQLENSENNRYSISWDVISKTNAMYLRQDISLVYANGRLQGMRSQWKENAETISFTEKFFRNEDLRWDVITYHHGEIHSPDDSIKSIQKLTNDRLYVVHNNRYQGFHTANTSYHSSAKEKLDRITKKELLAHWQDLLTHFHITIDDYYSVPLTDLYQYQDKAFPSLDDKEMDRIMGQLWEGLYKNYVIPIMGSEEKIEGFIPLILIEKEGNQLLVLYELNGSKEKLIQNLKAE